MLILCDFVCLWGILSTDIADILEACWILIQLLYTYTHAITKMFQNQNPGFSQKHRLFVWRPRFYRFRVLLESATAHIVTSCDSRSHLYCRNCGCCQLLSIPAVVFFNRVDVVAHKLVKTVFDDCLWHWILLTAESRSPFGLCSLVVILSCPWLNSRNSTLQQLLSNRKGSQSSEDKEPWAATPVTRVTF